MSNTGLDFPAKTVKMVKEIADTDNEFFAQHGENQNGVRRQNPIMANLKYGLLGILFGIVFVKAEIVSWFRIQEMFRFESFHMYGVIGSAVVVGIISVWLIKKFNLRSFDGEKIVLRDKKFCKGQIFGGLIFGLGWGVTGACPGPLFAQIGSGATVIVVTLLSAVAGTWVYGRFRNQLPH